VTAPLAAPFKQRDADLFAIVSGFDSAYSGYADFQSTMERYWCLRWLKQAQARQVDAVVLKDEVLRLVDIPLIIRLPGMPQVARGLQVKLDLLRWDEVDLNVEARLLEIATAQPGAEVDELGEDEEEEASDEVVEEGTVGEATEDAASGREPTSENDVPPAAE